MRQWKNIKIPVELWKQIKVEAAKKGITMHEELTAKYRESVAPPNN